MEKLSNNNKEYLTKCVTEFQNGDESAFGEIYHIISDKLLRYAMYWTGNPTDAEDLFQNTMIEIIKSIKTLRDPSAFTKWSITVMHNVYMRKIRKKSDVVARGDNDLELLENLKDEDASYRPDLAVEKLGSSAFIKEVMQRLPEEQRTAMILFYYDEFSIKEISEMMGVSENTTKSRLFSARKTMKAEIEKYEKRTGIRMHEFVPAPFIVEFMRHIFDGSNIREADVLTKIFRKVLEETGISATLPSSPINTDSPNEAPDADTTPDADTASEEAPDTTEPDVDQTPDDAPDTTEPDADQTPDDASDTTEPDADQTPDDASDTTEPDADQTPDDAPDTTEPDADQTPDDAPDTTEPDADQTPDDASDTTEPDANQTPDDTPDEAPDADTASEEAPDTTEPDTSQAPDDAPDTDTTPDADTATDEAPDTTEPDTSQAPDDAPDTTEPDANQAPEDTPDTTEPDASQTPDDAPDASESASNEDSHVSDADNENRARRINRAQKNIHEAKTREARANRERARRAARNSRKALAIKLLAAALGIVVIGGISLKVAFPDLISSLIGSREDVSAYSKAYTSVLSLYEEEIRGYNWQYLGFSDSGEMAEGTADRDIKPVALKDIDGDGIPELFFMASVYDDMEASAKCADLHIFTFKNNKVQEVSYYSEYPNEYPAEYYDGWFGYSWVRHDGRMVHYDSFEPNTAFVVFTGKEENELYILSANTGSETSDYRMRKYALENNRLDITSDTYEVETGFGVIHSENPVKEINSAIADMDEMVIYGGYNCGLGKPDDSAGEVNADAEVYGWKGIQSGDVENDADIAPEMFQSSLCMTYDEAVNLLKEQISDKKKSVEDGEEEYIPLRYDENIYQAGDMLFRYNTDTYELQYIKNGESEVKTLSNDFFRGSDHPFINGDNILYFDHSAGDDRQLYESHVVPLVRYNLATGETETIHEFENPPDPNASHYLGAVYDGFAYVGYDGGENPSLWACDLESGEITEMQEHLYIKDSYGKYVVANGFHSLSAVDVMQTDIYELKGEKMEHVADLGSKVYNSYNLINGNIYYSAIGDDDKLTTYKFNFSDASIDTLIRFSSSDIFVSEYSEAYCLYSNKNFEMYKGTYKTENSYWIPSNW